MQTVETIGKNLVNLKEALLEVHKRIEPKGGEKYLNAEKLSVRIYKQHLYTHNEGDYSENKKLLSDVEEI